MDAAEPDVHQTLEYRGDATIAGLLPLGLVLCFLASLVLALVDRPEPGSSPRSASWCRPASA